MDNTRDKPDDGEIYKWYDREIDVSGTEKKYVPTMDDHMNSLFFIAKLKGIKLEKDGFDRIVSKWNIEGGI